MIDFHYETAQDIVHNDKLGAWISDVIVSESCSEGEINYVFCDDKYLLKMNQQFLDHDTYTDIISFDNSMGKELHGDIFISTERVRENARIFDVSFEEELRRVLVHGVLHFCGYKDKTKEESDLMRAKEDEKLAMFHVEQ